MSTVEYVRTTCVIESPSRCDFFENSCHESVTNGGEEYCDKVLIECCENVDDQTTCKCRYSNTVCQMSKNNNNTEFCEEAEQYCNAGDEDSICQLQKDACHTSLKL